MSSVAIVVTHLLGTGHLARALVLARAFRAADHRVTVLSGGMPVPHLDRDGIGFVQLDPLRSDGVNFSRLLRQDGAVAGPDDLAARARHLCDAVAQIKPDVLITELFPFGRRVLRAEFGQLLETASAQRPKPLICVSIRDILAPPSKPEKADKTHALLARYYDAVLVHSDPMLAPLEASWPVSPDARALLHYTGFVANAPATDHPEHAGAGEILVTAGGGDVDTPLFEAALAAAALDPARRWRLLVGGADAQSRCDAMRPAASDNAILEPARPDFRQMLRHAAASVSMCGYNTALDILQAATPAVFVPFDAGGEVEQTLRARSLAAQDGMEMLRAGDVTPQRLLDHIDRALAAPARNAEIVETAGAARTVEIVEQLRAGQPT